MCTTHINYVNIVCNLLLDDVHVNCFLLAKSNQLKSLSLCQKKELMRSFLNNSKLTYNAMMKLSYILGITPGQVRYFFQMRSKIPRSVTIEAYSKLSQGNRV